MRQRHTYDNPKLHANEPWHDAEWEFLKTQCRVCLLLHISWNEWESYDNKLQEAFIYAYNDVQKEIADANK